MPLHLFSYTIAGVFLASYSTSPVGPYDECAILPVTLWRPSLPPLLGAWGTLMVVTSSEAVAHGSDTFGLPTCLGTIANQAATDTPATGRQAASRGSLSECDTETVEVSTAAGLRLLMDLSGPRAWGVNLRLPMRLPLPSFAGALQQAAVISEDSSEAVAVEGIGGLLHYNIWMAADIELRSPVDIQLLSTGRGQEAAAVLERDTGIRSVLNGRPLGTLLFRRMDMQADIPASCN